MMDNYFPEDWSLSPLEDCMEAIIDYRGKTPRKSSFGIPLITAKIVKDGRILEPNEFIPFEDYDVSSLVKSYPSNFNKVS
jgi:type I restriction enzyme S subunit